MSTKQNQTKQHIFTSIYFDIMLCSNNPLCDFKQVLEIFALASKLKDFCDMSIYPDVIESINFYTTVVNKLHRVKSRDELKAVIKYFYIDHIDSKLLMSEYNVTQALSRIAGHLVWRCISAMYDPRMIQSALRTNASETMKTLYVEWAQRKLSDILLEIEPNVFELLQKAEATLRRVDSDRSAEK